MSAIRMVYITCDGEGCDSTTADETFDRATDARHFAHQAGWRHRGGRDLCPWCAVGRGPYHWGDEHIRTPPGSPGTKGGPTA